MTIKEMRKSLGITQNEFALRYNIPFRTIQNWEDGSRKPPEYLIQLLEEKVKEDLINRKTLLLPVYDKNKKNLPKKGDYPSPISWLRAIRNCLGDNIVFALDEALMCDGSFLGRDEEFIIWIYGNDDAKRYNGVVVLGNKINEIDIINQNGLLYTNLNRTLIDSFANEKILDMQGITEALSEYYYSNKESFAGIQMPPQYLDRFEQLANDAIEYYNY